MESIYFEGLCAHDTITQTPCQCINVLYTYNRRKFRSQTSDKNGQIKSRDGKSQRREEKKKEDQKKAKGRDTKQWDDLAAISTRFAQEVAEVQNGQEPCQNIAQSSNERAEPEELQSLQANLQHLLVLLRVTSMCFRQFLWLFM